MRAGAVAAILPPPVAQEKVRRSRPRGREKGLSFEKITLGAVRSLELEEEPSVDTSW